MARGRGRAQGLGRGTAKASTEQLRSVHANRTAQWLEVMLLVRSGERLRLRHCAGANTTATEPLCCFQAIVLFCWREQNTTTAGGNAAGTIGCHDILEASHLGPPTLTVGPIRDSHLSPKNGLCTKIGSLVKLPRSK